MQTLKQSIEENNQYLKNHNVNNNNSLGYNKSKISDLYNKNCRYKRENYKSINMTV